MTFGVRSSVSAISLAALALCDVAHAAGGVPIHGNDSRPNILFIMTDDHGTGALSCYGSNINKTPNLDRIAQEGMLLKNCFVTTSLCSPSRASILTGVYPHMNGQVDIGGNFFDGTQPTFVNILQSRGYQTSLFGKWHLHSEPVGFDEYSILVDQGTYYDPDFITKTEFGPVRIPAKGYSTDLITDKSIEWLEKRRDKSKPFVMLTHYKSPHYNWKPSPKHETMYEEDVIPKPETFEHVAEKPPIARQLRIENVHEVFKIDHWSPMPKGADISSRMHKNYNDFIKNYLRCIASVDDNVGRILDYLRDSGLAENTIVVYTSDNGMLQGDHGLVDKQLMFDESIRVPFLIRYPKEIKQGTISENIVLNTDYAPSFLDYAGEEIPDHMQGRSARKLFAGDTPADWRTSFYYQYYAHYDRKKSLWGVRTKDMKLTQYWQICDDRLIDLKKDPLELTDVSDDPAYASKKKELQDLIKKHRAEIGLTDELLDGIYNNQGTHRAIPAQTNAEMAKGRSKEFWKIKNAYLSVIDENTKRWNQGQQRESPPSGR